VIWVGTDDGNVQVTKDGGKSWSNVTAGLTTPRDGFANLPANTWCYHIEASVFDKGTAYAVFDGHTSNDKKAYLYKTTDFGQTWTSLVTDDIYGFARSFQEDLENPNLLFLGTEFGLYVSITGGKNWMKFENNMPSTAIHYIEMQGQTNDLILGTHGRGIIIVDDISPLRELTDKVISEKVHFMQTEPFEMNEESTFGGTSSETQFVGDNPSTGARITYFMSKRHTFGKMKMGVYSMDDKYITELSPGKKKGLNMVYWNFNMSAAKFASGKTFAQGGFFAPRVPAGKYKIKLMKGKETYETTVEVKYPENSLFSLAERKKQQEVTMKLYKMNEDLAYLVYELDQSLMHMKMFEKSNKMPKAGAKAKVELTKLKETLVITSGDNYVGRAENQLREDLGDIYSTIGGNYGAPSESQLKNVSLLEGKLNDAMSSFDKIKQGNLKKYFSAVQKAGGTPLKIKTYEEFVKKEK